ncbi:MAG: phage holin family protein [Anditalea sp.]
MSNIAEIVKTIKEIIEIRIQMIKGEIRERITSLVSRVVVLVLMGITALFMLVFASFSLAFYLSELSRSAFMGFLYVAGIYLLILIVLYFIRNSLKLQANLKSSFTKLIFYGKKRKDDE